MVKIYTKTGDQGETGLVSGKRVSKSDTRVDIYGEIDELNSRIGFSHSLLGPKEEYNEISTLLHKIQSSLFDLGSNLACEAELRAKYKLPSIQNAIITELESSIDTMEQGLAPLRTFILPGGSLEASSVHLCRTSARRCERMLVSFNKNSKEDLPENSLIFLNRLSDYFFVLARYLNKMKNTSELPWIKT